jgi:hypothetical protein
VCQTAALRASNESFKVSDYRKKTIITYDISSVFTPQILVSSINNKIVNISSCENGLWITNGVRFTHSRIYNDDPNDNDTSLYAQQIANELQKKTMDKKVFIIGEYIDIESLFLLEYIVNQNDNCLIVIDDSQIDKSLIDRIYIDKEGISYVNCAVFVGITQQSIKYYIQNYIKKIQTSLYFNNIESIPDLSGYNNPYIFIDSKGFPFDANVINHLASKFTIIPKNNSQIVMKYLKNYISILEFEERHNRHDVKFICSIGETSYFPKYKVDNFCIKGRHFLEDSCVYMNIFGEIVKTATTVKSSSISTREFLAMVIKELYEEDYIDVLHAILSQIKTVIPSELF